jgi:hypothetical protein
MGSLEQDVSQVFAVKLGSAKPTGVGLLSSHTGREEVGEFGHICLGIHLVFLHEVYDPDER